MPWSFGEMFQILIFLMRRRLSDAYEASRRLSDAYGQNLIFFFNFMMFGRFKRKNPCAVGSNRWILDRNVVVVIHKLRYVFAPEHSLQTWNDGNITKNLLRHFLCYLISLISTYMTFRTFYCKFMLII